MLLILGVALFPFFTCAEEKFQLNINITYEITMAPYTELDIGRVVNAKMKLLSEGNPILKLSFYQHN